MSGKMRTSHVVGCAVAFLTFVCLASAQCFERLTLCIKPIQASYPSGVDVQLVVAVTNISDKPATFRNLRFVPTTAFEVRDEEGNLAPETENLRKAKEEFYQDGKWRGHRHENFWVGPFSDDDTVLQPGKIVSFGAKVNLYYDVSRPGVYSIIAKRKRDSPPYGWIYSNEIQVTITQAKP
jgi:hypothetical protein